MPVAIPRSLVEYILLQDHRHLQDFPILSDVWIAYARQPERPQELLITPHYAQPAASVAVELYDLIAQDRRNAPKTDDADIAHLHGIIAARLYFDEVVRVVVPTTEWWLSQRNRREGHEFLTGSAGSQRLNNFLSFVNQMLMHWSDRAYNRKIGSENVSALERYAALAGIILWAKNATMDARAAFWDEAALAKAIANATPKIVNNLTRLFITTLDKFPLGSQEPNQALVWQISLNRHATVAVSRSIPAVKGDAARTLFSVRCANISWAIIDSGIQGNHPSFKGPGGKSRVQKSFDFRNFRRIVSLDNLRIFAEGGDNKLRAARLERLRHENLRNRPSRREAARYLTSLARDVRYKRQIHWEFVEPFIEIKIDVEPYGDHGTHVAGIIGASREGATSDCRLSEDEKIEHADGMCPDIELYDFRVLADSVEETEFAIIAALQYIRYMNERNDYITIHGANLSLSIPHDMRNYACGRTPVCVECERLVDNGVVVVAAVGNLGFQTFTTQAGSFESFVAFSVTDPGNADNVITVGATHRYSPHTYGVSFFPSRGPTADGRIKPDLLAPGERIRAPFRKGWGDLDGTSMAAAHVSGAAAMLMAHYSELIGQPRRIKQILCGSATDLGRERSFQGHGMLDVLRAFQSI